MQCQITIDERIILQGGQQLSGLEAPNSSAEAVNAATIVNNTALYGSSTGINDLTCTVNANITSLQAGMSLFLHIANANTDSVSLSVNGLNAVPIRKNGIEKLEPGDLLAGMQIQIVFDGSAFQVLTAPERPKRPCPPSAVEINSQYCIEPDERAALDFPDAANVCGQLGGSICSWAEWSAACHRDSLFALNDMVGNYEWTNTGANGDDLVRIAGWNNCRSAGTNFSISSTPRPFRCCFRR